MPSESCVNCKEDVWYTKLMSACHGTLSNVLIDDAEAANAEETRAEKGTAEAAGCTLRANISDMFNVKRFVQDLEVGPIYSMHGHESVCCYYMICIGAQWRWREDMDILLANSLCCINTRATWPPVEPIDLSVQQLGVAHEYGDTYHDMLGRYWAPEVDELLRAMRMARSGGIW